MLLWLPLSKPRLGEVLATTAQLACVIAVTASCDRVSEDTGGAFAIVVGLGRGERVRPERRVRRLFFQALVQLSLGLLFISSPATVTSELLQHVLSTLGLVAVLVLATRSIAVLVSTLRTA